MENIQNINNLTQDSFCQRNKISSSDFEKANICWDDLMAIGLDHQRLFDARKESAEFFAKVIQGCNKVHSVRWRVKDPQHLMEKIVRKRNPDSNVYNEKYTSISVCNYHEIVTDLVGVRALHLFKDDYLDIDSYLRDNWSHIEKPIYYHREGDVQDSVLDIFDKKPHPAGYRSIHYIFTSQPLNKILLTEVQVRTIFEEGWSEIDHVVRYPNFSNNQHVSNFLQIFNRLSGSADEMGSFAKQLAKELQDRTEMLEKLQREYDETKAENSVNEDKIKSLFSQLKDLSDDNADKSALISELEHAVEKKNRMASLMDNDAFLSTLNRNIPIHLNANIPSAAMLGTLSEKQKKVIEDAALLTNKIVSNINLATSSTHNFNLSSSKNNNNEVGAKIKPKKTPVK
ncbi:RelA/SpoT domain-containing protein [Aeromonas veronii]|uniref:RelA/SpoT domain-containing protein n=1 Tax=Aeromonas TaxID=642 RepID=UPI002B3138D2|nr:hypothetical protein VAWG002_29740 [Aeromonas veronii]